MEFLESYLINIIRAKEIKANKEPIPEIRSLLPLLCKPHCLDLYLNDQKTSCYSVDSIKHTVLLKVLSLLSVLFSTVYNSIYSIFNRDFLKYQEKKVREKLNVRYV